MAYLATIAFFLITWMLYQHYVRQVARGTFSTKHIIMYLIILGISGIALNNVNNRVLPQKEPRTLVKQYAEPVVKHPSDYQLKPLMNTEERQERTDILIDRKQITGQLYDK